MPKLEVCKLAVEVSLPVAPFMPPKQKQPQPSLFDVEPVVLTSGSTLTGRAARL